jgi:hypothetical protein
MVAAVNFGEQGSGNARSKSRGLGNAVAGARRTQKEFSFCLRETYALVIGEGYEISTDKRARERRCLTLAHCCVKSGASPEGESVSYYVGVVVAGDVHVPSLDFNELYFDVPNLGKFLPGSW